MPDATPAADAEPATPDAAEAASSGDGGRPTAESLREVLRDIEDPELRMSIVDLGLVYHVDIDDDGLVTIDLTLTTPACPIGPMLQGQAYHMLTQIEGVEDVEVNLVWDPPWDPKTMASEEVRMQLGIW
jgi:metal-sulfur cluster biosynthetic enzyme